MCSLDFAAFRMFKAVASEGRREAPRTRHGVEDGIHATVEPSSAELASRVRELEAQLRQRDNEIRVLAAMRRTTMVAG